MTRDQYLLMETAERASRLGLLEEAHEALDRAACDPELSLEATGRKLNLLLREKRWEEAARLARALCRFEPEEPDHLGRLAEALRGMGHPQKALDLLRRVPAACQSDPAHQYRLGVCHATTGDVPAAVRHLREAIRLDPGLGPQTLADPELRGIRDLLDLHGNGGSPESRTRPPERALAPALAAVPLRPQRC